jgi:Helix-turn-helix domain
MTGSHMEEELMTRRQVAAVFRVTSAAVATWARRGRLPEVRDEVGRPRYRRADVEALFRGGTGTRRSPRPGARNVTVRRSLP